MSRHRNLHQLDLDDELDDYDGDYGEEEELNEEDAEQMRTCTAQVRSALQQDVPQISDKEIQDSLWHYYYDVEKSVSWLKGQRKKTEEKSAQKSTQAQKQDGQTSKQANELASGLSDRRIPPETTVCRSPFSATDFFRDSPWLRVPKDRQSQILIEPLYPSGGLLGGSSSGSSGKPSKLAALAASRRKKEAVAVTRETASVSKPTQENSRDYSSSRRESQTRDIGDQLRKNSASHQVAGKGEHTAEDEISRPDRSKPELSFNPAASFGAPSKFANVILGRQSSQNGPETTHVDSTTSQTRPQPLRYYSVDSNVFTGPSPDDVVATAQSRTQNKSSKNQKQTSDQKETDTNQAAKGVASVSIGDHSRVKSKHLDVVHEYEKSKKKKAASFVVIGHVDHGKSTMMGRLLLDLGVVDARSAEKLRKEADSIGKSSFALAWVLDQTNEERSRGVTVDIATNQFETEKSIFTILDAPGHQDFIPNMIAGASQADFAVLVIDGSSNAFEAGLRGQTKEHALLVRSMGVQRVIVAVNKMDLVDWSHERFTEIKQQTLAFLSAAGFQSRNIVFVPCSGLTGENVVQRVTSKASWSKGPSLLGAIEDSEPVSRALSKPFRMTVGDIFRGGVTNPLSVSGRVEAGTLQIGDSVLAMPSGETAYIKGIEIDNGVAEWAVAGQITTVHLTDIDPIHLKSGDVLCSPISPLHPINAFTTKVLAFNHLTPMAVDVHRGRLHVEGQITQLIASLDKSSGQIIKKKPKIIQPGSVARVKVELGHSVPLEAPTRIVLRASGETVAAGLIE